MTTTPNDETRFQGGKVYRGKAVQWKLDKTREDGTNLIEVMLEVTMGPLLGRRIRWTGWITDQAIDRTVDELTCMGWRATEFGRWDGLGSKEVEFTCMADRTADRTYYRAAFVRPLAELTQRNTVSETEAAALSRKYAHVLKPRSATSSASPRPSSEAFDDIPPPPDEGECEELSFGG